MSYCNQNRYCYNNNCSPYIIQCPPQQICPNVTFITSATAPFPVLSTPPGTVPTPPIGATSLLASPTIIPISGPTLVTTPETNCGGINYNPSNGQFTIPISGRYIISAFISFAAIPIGNNLGISREVYIFKVDAQTNIIILLAADTRAPTTVGPTRITVTTIANLNANDRIFFAVAQNTGQIIDIFPIADPANRFAITRIC